jgi:hypothetical protein
MDDAARIAAVIGRSLETARHDDARAIGLGPTSRRTFDLDDALTRLHASAASPAAKSAAVRSRAWIEALPAPDAVIHSDMHFFNLCVDANEAITGLFDFGDSGIDAAATELDLDGVRRAHVRTALDHVIWHGPGTERHAGVVGWATAVLERFC